MSAGSAEPRNLSAFLTRLQSEAYTGSVLVSGSPGGTIHVRKGLVVAVETPGSPSPEQMLLKSGRLDEASWTAAAAASAAQAPFDPSAATPEDSLAQELVRRGLVGAIELQVLCTAALFDGAFALSVNTPDTWEKSEARPIALTAIATEPARLAAETSRRIAQLTRMWRTPREISRARIRPGNTAVGRIRPRHTALLKAVNGRRTARDMAFALGRGLYPVMVDLASLHALGLVDHDTVAVPARPSTAPRTPEAKKHMPAQPTATALPKRAPGTHRPQTSNTP
ncbi:hypothetical protein ACWD3J_10305 [Streptomyces sp. NPDC002755]|uniref:hypothetical protein n=1 Tax=Streptomyces sp. NPDC002884 TaxID=3154544 RepID=UPI00333051EB